MDADNERYIRINNNSSVVFQIKKFSLKKQSQLQDSKLVSEQD